MKIQMLLDTDHYNKLNKDTTTKVEKQTRDVIKELSIPKKTITIREPTTKTVRTAKDTQTWQPSQIDLEDTLEIIKQQLPKGLQPNLINLAKLCLTSTYFLWNGEFYEQATGAAIGSLLSPIIANIFMEAFELEAIESSRMKPKCWYRYVDNTFVIWPLACVLESTFQI
ncbi:hypothetical protein Trydic_g6053 [Trypoxylus dichotomus]